jgi:predicted transcriptional regulator
MKLFDSELKIMEILWREGDISAKRIAEIAKEQIGWRKTTTYTNIKRCIDKGAVNRYPDQFICHPLVTKEETQEYETNELINKMYGGAADQLVASILGKKNLSSEEIERLKQLVKNLE